MFEDASNALFNSNYMPHGMCYAWEPGILWTSVISDLVIATAYFSIPFAILFLVQKRKINKHLHLYWLFAAFIFLCGLTHLYGIYVVWEGSYGPQSLLKALTAIVSLATAVMVYRYLPIALTIPSKDELDSAMVQAAQNKLFKDVIEQSPIGLMLVDKQFKMTVVNHHLASLFGYRVEELEGKPVNLLVDNAFAETHTALMQNYSKKPESSHSMAYGRTIYGYSKDKRHIPIEISLTPQKYNNESHIFVSVFDVKEKTKNKELAYQAMARTQRIAEATHDGLWEWNLVTDEVWMSDRQKEMIGLNADQGARFEDWFEHVHPDYRDIVLSHIRANQDEGKEFQVDYLGRTQIGGYQWFRARGDSLFNSDGKAILMSGALTNIDTIKRFELNAVKRSKTLEKVLDKTICGVYIFNLKEHKTTYINHEYSYLTGYQLSHLQLMDLEDNGNGLIHPDDLERFTTHFKDIVSNPDYSKVLLYRFKHANGNWIWCLSKDSILSRYSSGKPKELMGTFIDVTELKESEETQRRLRKDFENTFDQAAVGICHISLDGRFIKANEKISEILGYPSEQLHAMRFQDITHPLDLNDDLQHLNQLLSGEIDFYAIEKRYIHSNQRYVWARLTVSLVRDGHNEPEYFISVIEDISHRKQLEESLIRLNKDLKRSNDQLTRFAYSASHDMQEPLRKITSFSSSLYERLSAEQLDDTSRFELDRLISASMRMRDMISRLLELSRSSNIALKLEDVLLSEVLQDAKEQLSMLFKDHPVSFIVNSDGALYCDKQVMSTVLQNLIKNSVKYQHESRPLEIEINCEQEGGYSIIEFSDNGIGFDNKYKNKIFEPFKRLVNHSEIEGTGMGLAICNQLVHIHGGQMRAEGMEGQGSVFFIQLPINVLEINFGEQNG
ncbi:PAS domain S-box protein [Bermanella marisrubri]|uniref:histidine kinase n=1 Tax=Bermanella marisrubri TaxID=207949 RepID=Q1N0I5_9GAMM|nr:PAS domain S-box protein [Bermanella marisrubri]EAT11679.1 sensory box histidine kinase [Oceanobacter sp. RED65] [Bermanella marisrubri]QIZ83285.1 PAS domain S-box protein [Bermanella marisrubri]